MPVLNVPGSTRHTSTPNGSTSHRSASLNPSTACLVAAYTLHSGSATRPARLETLMMRPRCAARIDGSTARVTAISPNTLVSNCWRTSSSDCSSKGPLTTTPALLTRAWTGPYLSVSSRILAAAPAAVTSSCSTATVTPRASAACKSAVRRSGSRMVATTR